MHKYLRAVRIYLGCYVRGTGQPCSVPRFFVLVFAHPFFTDFIKTAHVMRTWTFCILLFAHQWLHATTWYVSNSGSDLNDGLSPGTAFATIQHAENQCGPGDSVLVANGEYAGFYVNVSGTAVAPIVFLALGNAVSITSPTSTTDGINVEGVQNNTVDYIEINGFIVNDMPRNGIRLVWANHCIVRNCACDNNFERGIFTGFTDDILIEYNVCSNSIDEHGIYVSNSSDRSILRFNICHHNNRGGIQINADVSAGGDGISTDPLIYGNILFENGNAGGAAINLDGVQGAFIFNNLLYENHASGIALFRQEGGGPSINATVVHNTIVNASNGRWCILIVNGATGAQVYNNIIINQHPWRGSIALSADAVSGFNSDYNILVNSMSNQGDGVTMTLSQWQALGYDAHSMLHAPINDIFVNPPAGDYHLKVNAQPIDVGSAAFALGVVTDLDGNTRPTGSQHDIGAYEDQNVVLFLREEKTTIPSVPRWTSIAMDENRITVNGLEFGDQVSLCDAAARLFASIRSDDSGIVILPTTDLPSGIYLLYVTRSGEVIGVSRFAVMRR